MNLWNITSCLPFYWQDLYCNDNSAHFNGKKLSYIFSGNFKLNNNRYMPLSNISKLCFDWNLNFLQNTFDLDRPYLSYRNLVCLGNFEIKNIPFPLFKKRWNRGKLNFYNYLLAFFSHEYFMQAPTNLIVSQSHFLKCQ